MLNVRRIIRENLLSFFLEQKLYDDIIDFKKWYEEEREKIDKITDYKTWKAKNSLLAKQYNKKMNQFGKAPDAYALKGDVNAKFLYHYTTGESLLEIINSNEMYGDYGGISFTTHPNLYKRKFVFWHSNRYSKGRDYRNVGVKIKFDFTQMKEDGLIFKQGSEGMGTHAGEEEIRLKSDQLENPLKYVKEIIIIKDKEQDYLKISEFLNSKNIDHKVV